MKYLTIIFFTLLTSLAQARQKWDAASLDTIFKYRIGLTDKNYNEFTVDKPEMFLSQKAIDRRTRYGIRVDETDLPVSRCYVDSIRSMGVRIHNLSKWNNSLVIQMKDTSCMKAIRSLGFVRSVTLVAVSRKNQAPSDGRENKLKNGREDLDPGRLYGKASNQINQLHGREVHDRGYRGEGVTIAIIDGGFKNADIIPVMKGLNIEGCRDFVNPKDDMFAETNHGMKVLSCMAMNSKNLFIGTAPEASYWLLRSEDTYSEQPVEEDNWVAAVEYADSVGVDVINSSLGYTKYDAPHNDVRYWELDGKTHLMSRVASMLASKGMILCTSAGNEGDKPWKKISVPADASDVLTVGAVDVLGVPARFSSVGDASDGRIKPDVCAMGERSAVIDPSGFTSLSNGTSFSSPILAGMVACLWQALPELNAYEIMDIVRKSGNYAEHPNNVYGYGIPNFMKALKLGWEVVDSKNKAITE